LEYCQRCRKLVDVIPGVVYVRNVVDGKNEIDDKVQQQTMRDIHCAMCCSFIGTEKVTEIKDMK
jgi:hypothetical protein